MSIDDVTKLIQSFNLPTSILFVRLDDILDKSFSLDTF
jgi:hypothetical protein